MDKITHKVRCEQWTKIIKECLASGMNKTAWCREHGISDKSFFYWQRRLREEAYISTIESSSPPAVKSVSIPADPSVDFVELRLPEQSVVSSAAFRPDVIIRKDSFSIEISNTASAELLSRIGGLYMLNDATGFDKIFIATGYTDLRRGIDGLASTIKYQFELDPFQKNILFLFCGKRTDRIKGLVWEGDGFLLLYKRLNVGGFSWPRTKEEC